MTGDGHQQAPDPVRARRARIARANRVAQRAGYALLAVAVAVFMVGAFGRHTQAIVSTVVGCLVASSVLLVPSIIIGYGVRAAEREDRRAGR